MITSTHLVINAFATRIAPVRRRVDDHRGRIRWFLLGGIAPDTGLFVLTVVAGAYFVLVDGRSVRDSFDHIFDTLFFESPAWIAAHNVLHSPLMLVWLFLAAHLIGTPRWLMVRAFVTGCAVHSLIDIAVHHDDGPLLFFPIDWTTRFISPVSYWDPDHYGDIVGPIDLAVTVVGGSAYLIGAWRRRSKRASLADGPGAPAQAVTDAR